MPYTAEGERHSAVATKACAHGQLVVENNMVGTAFKVTQPDRFTTPAAYPAIAIGDPMELLVGGIHEVPVVAPYAAAVEGSRLWINPATNAIDDAVATGWIPVGVIDEIDTSRTPAVARVNSNAWQAFLPGA